MPRSSSTRDHGDGGCRVSGMARATRPAAAVARPHVEVSAVAVEARSVQDVVIGVKVDVGAVGHRPVLVIAEDTAPTRASPACRAPVVAAAPVALAEPAA